MKTTFLRVLEASDKATALLEAVREPERSQGRQRFDVDPASFTSAPRSPFAYWVSDRLRGLFKELPPFEAEGRTAKQGLATADDFRFVRTAWEVSPGERGPKWFPFAKGGKFSRFYADVYLVVNWECDGREISNLCKPGSDRIASRPQNTDYFFRPGLTWPARPHKRGAFSHVPAGCIFSTSGTMIFCPLEQHWALCAILNSDAFIGLLHLLMPRGGGDSGQTLKYEVGYVTSVPVSALNGEVRLRLGLIVRNAWSLKRSLDTRNETSHAFCLPALLQVAGADVATRVSAFSKHVNDTEAALTDIQAEIDERCFALYGINEADRHAITEGFGGTATERDPNGDADEPEDDAGDDPEEIGQAADPTVLAAELISWTIGVAFGRFDLRLATGARQLPSEPEPFDPLPTCSPAMLTGADGLPLTHPPTAYPLSFPEAGVLVNDPGHAQDLTTAVRTVFDTLFAADSDRWWSEVSALLDPRSHDIRSWLAASFFEHHLKRYSKSRRKAPIFWQLGAPSGCYSVLLYAHRLTRDTFFQLQNDVVGPKLTHEERQLTSLIQTAGSNPSASERKEIAAQEAVVEELHTMLEEVKSVAPLWNPNLDDGVVLTMAPLWRLVTQHKPWQKELKTKWQELAAGKYDWAHLAMHLWPERVVPKCTSNRSLAIAHGLEDVFWVEGSDGKWTARKTPTRPLDDLIRERSSSAVKAALTSLLDAPKAQTPKRSARTRGAR